MNTNHSSLRKSGRPRVGIACFVALIASLAIQSAPGAVFVTNSPLNIARAYHTTTLLQNGKLLVAGGYNGNPVAITELYDPATGIWTTNGALTTPRYQHTATLLPNGKVLVAGGQVAPDVPTNSAELFDPLSGTWTPTAPMNIARYYHGASLLANGLVLVAGGDLGSSTVTNIAELYNPATGAWTLTGPMQEGCYAHTATLLSDGTVLTASGLTPGIDPSCQLYNPVSNTWSYTGYMNFDHSGAVGTRLPNGQMLVAGGIFLGAIKSAELYNPTNSFYNPTQATWSVTGSLNSYHVDATATLLPSGKVFVVSGSTSLGGGTTNATELYDPATASWTYGPPVNTGRYFHTATLLPGGQLMIVGGFSSSAYLSSVESITVTANATWTAGGSMTEPVEFTTATLLSNGKVLVAGGRVDGSIPLSGSQLYDPPSGTWNTSGPLNAKRYAHSATLLGNGKVLIAGGFNGSNVLSSAEVYDPSSQIWTTVSPMSVPRVLHTATLLTNGKVLVVGGIDSIALSNIWFTAELFDPVTQTWTNTGSLNFNIGRWQHMAIRLPTGKVLVAGGGNADSQPLAVASLYDPVSGTWSATGTMTTARIQPVPALLPNGKVLVADASGGPTTELYDPVAGIWTATGSMNFNSFSTLTLLQDGTVLAGANAVETYDPARGVWTTNTLPITPRTEQTTTFLTNGLVLIAGGSANSSTLMSSELFSLGSGFSNSWQPQITGITAQTAPGNSLVISGVGFRGISEGSGGNESSDSPADYPVVQLRSLDSGLVMFPTPSSWSTNSFVASVTNFPEGPVMATIFVNGIPSRPAIVTATQPLPGPVRINSVTRDSAGIHLSATNVPGQQFSVLTSPNAATPMANWTVLGVTTEVSSGNYQFTDPQTTNFSARFYRLRWP